MTEHPQCRERSRWLPSLSAGEPGTETALPFPEEHHAAVGPEGNTPAGFVHEAAPAWAVHAAE
eukprot:12636297-Alexandrium_andersonii.AAC.1